MPTKQIKKPTSTTQKKPKDKNRYIEGIGRRKESIARVRIYPSTNKALKETADKDLDITVNDKPIKDFFPLKRLKQTAISPLTLLSTFFKVTVKVKGGGTTGQAEAIRLGLSRALNELNEKWRPRLKSAGFLTRDARVVERKKPGLRKARRPQQWRKR